MCSGECFGIQSSHATAPSWVSAVQTEIEQRDAVDAAILCYSAALTPWSWAHLPQSCPATTAKQTVVVWRRWLSSQKAFHWYTLGDTSSEGLCVYVVRVHACVRVPVWTFELVCECVYVYVYVCVCARARMWHTQELKLTLRLAGKRFRLVEGGFFNLFFLSQKGQSQASPTWRVIR